MTTNTPFKIPLSCSTATWETGCWGTRETDVWPEGTPKPRTCSYCGSVHPEDLIELIKLGWEYEPSTKGYKSYWHPPGFSAYHATIMANFDALASSQTLPKFSSPVPPVKLYSDHLTPELIGLINALLMINRAKARKEPT